jgi:hypothetical protein
MPASYLQHNRKSNSAPTHMPVGLWQIVDGFGFWLLRALAFAANSFNKSLARESVKGFGAIKDTEPWVQWLEMLRDARDDETGEFLYAKSRSGSVVISDREQHHFAGEKLKLPRGALTEFVKTPYGVERRWYSDSCTITVERLFDASARHCLRLRSLQSKTDKIPATNGGGAEAPMPVSSAKNYKTALGRNIDLLRKECGWSFDDLAKATRLDKKLSLGHVNNGRGAHPSTLETYASTFSEKLGRIIAVADLEK